MNKLNDLPDLIIFDLANVNSMIIRHGNRMIRESGLNLEMDQVPVIMTIFYTEMQSQQTIADSLTRNKASVARSVSYLQKMGIVTILQSGKDKRKNVIRLTDKGNSVALQVEKHLHEIERKLLSTLSLSERKLLKDLLTTLDEACKEI